jgi:hypothetical protein
MMRLRSEQGTDLVEEATETRGGGEGVGPAHRPIALLDPPMILLQAIVAITVGPVRHPVPKDVPNSARVGLLAIGGDAVWDDAGHDPGRAEEGLGCREVCVSLRRASSRGPSRSMVQ